MKSPSYKPSIEGWDCCLLGAKAHEPCWGRVEETDHYYFPDTDDYEPIYSCCGHVTSTYIPEPK